MARKATRLLLWIAAFGLMIAVAVTIAVVILVESGPPGFDQEPRWLHVRLSPAIAETPGNEPMFADPSDLPPLTTELTQALRDAAADDDVEGLFLEISPVGMGWAQVQELRDAVWAFRMAGKGCVAWSETMTNREYYLATACDEVLISPSGILLANGLALTQAYFKGAMDRFGVTANMEHVGEFKSAVEPYERTGPSDSASEATNALLDSLFEQFVAGIAQGRDWESDRARALIDDPPMTPYDALATGAVDGTAYRDELLDGRFKDDMLSMRDYLRERRNAWRKGSEAIAVVYAEGTIISGESTRDFLGGSYIGDATLREQLEKVRDDDDVAAVVLRISSSGGSGSASDAIWREMQLTRDVKPVVVSMGDYAASGGYYVAAGADRIVAQPGTLTGSIGVFGGKINFVGLYDEIGVSLHTYQRGRYANLLSSTSDFDDDERRKFRRYLGVFYQTFLDRVSEGRRMDMDRVHTIAQGRVWSGSQALELGLVDELGGLEVAVALARDLAQAPEARVVRIPERKGFFEQLMEELAEPTNDVDARAMMPGVREAISVALQLEGALGVDGVAALMPGRIEIR